MRKALRWIGIIVGVLLIVVIILAVVLYILGRNSLNQSFDDVQAESITVPTGSDALARGQHLAEAVSLCAECHGDDLGGKEFLDEPIFGTGDAPNLTADGIGAEYTTEDWVRAIRHGVKPDGDAIKLMPSQYYYYLSDADLGAIIAYIQSVPPVERDTDEISMGIIGTIVIGNMSDLPAEQIDDHSVRPDVPEEGVTAEYGEYLVNIAACKECHAEDLDGDVPPGAPAGPDLTNLGDWSEEDFINTMRQGITPDGDQLDVDEMPWDYYTRMTDDELRAMWTYLLTLQ
jgi:mono/diheme cytochrome c family protein